MNPQYEEMVDTLSKMSVPNRLQQLRIALDLLTVKIANPEALMNPNPETLKLQQDQVRLVASQIRSYEKLAALETLSEEKYGVILPQPEPGAALMAQHKKTAPAEPVTKKDPGIAAAETPEKKSTRFPKKKSGKKPPAKLISDDQLFETLQASASSLPVHLSDEQLHEMLDAELENLITQAETALDLEFPKKNLGEREVPLSALNCQA